MPVHAHRDRQIQVAHRAAGECDIDEPAIRAETLVQTRLDLGNLAAEVTRRIDQVASMSQHVIAPLASLRIPRRADRRPAGDDSWLDRVCHRVAVRRIAVPGFEREHGAHLSVDEMARRSETGVEALHMADLENAPGLRDDLAQMFGLFDRKRHRLLAKDVFARQQRRFRGGHMKRIRGGYDDRLHSVVGEHLAVTRIRLFGHVGARHALEQIFRRVADRVKIGVPGLDATVEVGGLRDGAAAEDAYLQTPALLGYHCCHQSNWYRLRGCDFGHCRFVEL